MQALAERVRQVCRSPSDIVNIPYSEAYEEGFEDMQRRVPDVAKIAAAIGWQPRVGLDRILEDVAKHCLKDTGAPPERLRA